jgi:hypothetical protein
LPFFWQIIIFPGIIKKKAFNTGEKINEENFFSKFSQETKGEFHFVVPKGWRNVAKHRSDAINVNVTTIWTPQ